jgi:glycine cleavage system H lipoate-binding protein
VAAAALSFTAQPDKEYDMESLLQHMALTEGISYLVSIGFAFAFIGFWRFLTGRERLATAPAHAADAVPSMAHGFALPANAFYHPGHGWAMLEPNGLVRIGVDDFLHTALGRLDAVELPRPGDSVTAGRPAFSLVQGQKRADVAAPVSGVVTEVNPALAAQPGLIKARPFDAGWVARVRPTALSAELPRLHVAERASAWLKREVTRLREFVLARSAERGGALGYTMADGGEISNGPLEPLDDAAWRAFMAGGEE